MAESNSGIEDKKRPESPPDTASDASVEQDSSQDDSSFDTSLRLSEEADDSSDSIFDSSSQDSNLLQDSDTALEQPQVQSDQQTDQQSDQQRELPTDVRADQPGDHKPSEAPEVDEDLKKLFESVDEAMSESQATTMELRRYLREAGRNTQMQVGSDSEGSLETVDGSGPAELMRFDLLQVKDSDFGDATTKVYQDGSVVTTLGDGTKLRFASPEGENAGMAEVAFNGEGFQSATHAEANVTLSSYEADGMTVSRNADATLTVQYSEPQPDGATSMTIFPRNSEGKKWARNFPDSREGPAHSVIAFANGDKQVSFDEPVRGTPAVQAHPYERQQIAMGLVPRAHELNLGGDAERLLLLGGERDNRTLSLPERIMSVSPFIINQSSAFIPAQFQGGNPFDPRMSLYNSGMDILQGRGNGRNNGFGSRDTSSHRLSLGFSGEDNSFGRDTGFPGFGQRDPVLQLLNLGNDRPTVTKEPEWLPAGEAVARLSQSRNSIESYRALRDLTELSRSGDDHATTALAATLVALTSGGEGLVSLQGLQHRGEPILAPNISNLSESDRRYMKTAIMGELGRNVPLSRIENGISLGQIKIDSMPLDLRISKNLPREAVLALSTAFTSENSSAVDRAGIESILRSQAHTDTGAYAIFHAARSGMLPQNEKLDQMLVEGIQGRRGEYFLDRLEDGAKEGNEHDIDLLAKTMGRDDLSPGKVNRSFNILRQAARDGNADQVLESLLETHEQYGDNGQILNCLGALVQDGSLSESQNETVMNVLREGIHSEESTTQKSAVEGFMRISSQWTESDLQILADNICPTTAEGLQEIGDKIDPKHAGQLATLLEERMRGGQYETPTEKASAATALGALAPHVSDTAPEALKEMITSTDLESIEDKGSRDKLVMAGVQSLMAIAGSRAEGADEASQALLSPGWKSTDSIDIGDDSVRRDLVDYVSGKITREEMSDRSRPATYNSGFPQSIHSLFREEGVGANVVEGLVEKARDNYSDEDIRKIVSRADLYNALPPQMRTEVFSEQSGQETPPPQPEQIDTLTVLGQMANGKLDTSDNRILLEPIEDQVREHRNDKAKERRETSLEYRTNDRETDESLRDLTKLTSKGVSTFQHFTSIFGDETLTNFNRAQISGLREYRLGLAEGEELSGDIQELNLEHQMLSAAMDSQRYGELRREGNETEADKLAMEMLKDYGRSLATISPDAWTDLGFESPGASSTSLAGATDGETVWQRLNRQGDGDSGDTPSIISGTPQGLEDALKELSINRDSDNLDTPTRRALALQALDGDRAVMNVSIAAAELQTQLPDIQKLVQAGLNGTRTETYARDVRESVEKLEKLYTDMNTKDPSTGLTPTEMARQRMEQMEKSLPDLAPEMQGEVQKRVDAMKQMLEFFDKDSPQGMQMQLMFDQVGSNDFNASTFGNWLKTDGIKTLGAIGGAVLAAGAITLSFGTATPLVMVAAAAAATAGGIIGHELTAEAMYQLGTGERTGALIMHSGFRDGLTMGEDGQARRMTVGESLGEYGKQFGYGFAISLATLGVGSVFKQAIIGIRGGASGALSANSQGFARLATRLSQVEQAVEKAGGQAVMKRWVQQMSKEFTDELVEEGLGQSAEIGMEHLLGKVNPALTVLTSALIANRKMGGKFDMQTKRNGSMEIDVAPDADTGVVMETLRAQLEADGLQVALDANNRSQMMVTTPEGDTMTLRLRGAETAAEPVKVESDSDSTSAAVDVDPTVEPVRVDSDAIGDPVSVDADASLEPVGVGADDGASFELPKFAQNDVNAPLTETDMKARRLGQLEADPASNPAEIEALKGEIVSDLRAEAAAQLQRAAGISPERANEIVQNLEINLEEYSQSDSAAGSFQSYSGALNMYMGADMPEGVRPHKTFIHEFTHELDAAKNTALFNANPQLYLENIVNDVMSNSFSGKQGIWNNPNARSQRDYLYSRLEVGEKGLTETDVTFAKEMLGKYLRQNISEGELPDVPTEQELADWIKDQDAYFPDYKQEQRLLREMVREISHAEVVLSESKFGSNALQNQSVQDLVSAFESESAGNDPNIYSHRMQGISSATTGLADAANYDFGSRYETRANRVQNRAIIESTHRVMPELAADLNSRIEGNPEFAELNAKLNEILPQGQGTSDGGGAEGNGGSRRDGVKLMEYFASAEGQAHLEKLQANPSTSELAQSIQGTVEARQEAMRAQRFSTALDQLPVRKQELEPTDSASSADSARAQEQYNRTLQSLMENAPDQDLSRLIKHLNKEGLATGEDVLAALGANDSSALAGREYFAVSGIVSSLSRTGTTPSQVLSALAGSNSNPQVKSAVVSGIANWDLSAEHISDLLTVDGDINGAAATVFKSLRPGSIDGDLSRALEIAQGNGKLSQAFDFLEQHSLVDNARLTELKEQFGVAGSGSDSAPESDSSDPDTGPDTEIDTKPDTGPETNHETEIDSDVDTDLDAEAETSTVEDAFRAHNQGDLIENLPKALRNLELESTDVVGSGAESLVFKIAKSDTFPNGAVLKLTAATEGGFDSSWGKRPFDAKKIGKVHDLGDGHYAYVQESLDTNVSDSHPGWAKLEQQLQQEGYEWVDGGKNQVGINANGDLVILDYGAVRPAGEGSRYNMVAQAEEAQTAMEESIGRTEDGDTSDDFSDLSESENDLDLRDMIDNPPNAEWKTALNEIYNQGGTVDDAVIARQIELNDFSPEAEARVRQEISDAQDWVNSRARNVGDGGDSDSIPDGRRRSANSGQDPNRTATDIQIEDLVTRLDREIRENGEGSEAATRIEGEIKELITTQANAYARKMGLVTRNADGSVDQVLVDPAKIQLIRGDESSSYGLDDVIRINLDNANDPTADVFHEMKHRAEMLERTAMRMGDPASYDHRVQQDVFGELSQGGNKRLAVIDGEMTVVERSELTTKEQKQQLASLLTEFGQNVPNIESASPEQINGWLAERPQVDYFGQQGIDRAALVDLMSQEIASYKLIRDQSILPSRTVESSSDLSEFLGAKQEGYAQRSAAGQPVANDPRARKLTNGITEETIGVAGDESHYNLFSPSERRAESADLARSMGIKLDGTDGDVDLGSERAVMQLHQTALALNTALAKHRATSDPEQQRELWAQAEGSAQQIVDILPENDLGREISRRLVDMELINNRDLPPGLRVEESAGRPKVSPGADTTTGDVQRRSTTNNPLTSGDSGDGTSDVSKVVDDLQAEIKPGLRLEGQRLEKVRDMINQLMEHSPAMRARLQPYADQLQPPVITGRTEQVKTELNSRDQNVRDAAVRTELTRLLNLSSPTRADVQEVSRLRRNLFESMRADSLIKDDVLNNGEMTELYDKMDSGQELTDVESKRLSELETRQSEYMTRTRSNLETMIDALKLEGQNEKVKMGAQAGGKSLESEVLRLFEDQLNMPHPAFGGRTPAQAGYEIIPMVNGSFMDDVGADMILVNKKNGDFVIIDPTKESLNFSRKDTLPALRKQGVISSNEENYAPGAKDAYLRSRVRDLISQLNEGTPLNLTDIAVPLSTREGQATNSLGAKDRLNYIKGLSPEMQAIELRQYRTELLERQQGLREINESSLEKEFKLKREARQAMREKDDQRAAMLTRQAQLLSDWRQHSDRSAQHHIDRTLQELDAWEQGLPPDARRLSRVPERPGQRYDVPPGLEDALLDSRGEIEAGN